MPIFELIQVKNIQQAIFQSHKSNKTRCPQLKEMNFPKIG